MQASIENISHTERRLTVHVPEQQVEAAYQKHINEIAKKANIKGFRPGKVPVNYVKERFSEDARKESVSEIVQNTLYDALASHKLQPMNTPRIELKPLVAGQGLEYIATFEILPEISEIKVTLKDIEKPLVQVNDDDVKHVIEQLMKQHTKWDVVERSAQVSDRVVIDYYAIFEGKEEMENKIQNFPLELGSKRMLPGFSEGLIGVTAGEERKLELTFPEDFEISERAGKPVEFVVQIKQVFEAESPQLNEDFIKKLGISNGKEEELRNQIKHTLEQESERLVKEKVKEQIFRQLLEQNPIEIPKTLVQREARRIHDEFYGGHEHHHSEDEMTSFQEVASKRVAIGLLINEYAKQQGMKVDKERVYKRIQDIASSYEHPQEVIKWLSNNEQQRYGVEAQIIEDQVMDKLIEGITLIEKKMGYAELKRIHV